MSHRDIADAYLGTPAERRRAMREILRLEESVFPSNSKGERRRVVRDGGERLATLAAPRRPPTVVHGGFLSAPAARRRCASRSPDVLFNPENGTFTWLYASQRVSQSTVGNSDRMNSPEDVAKTHVWAMTRRKVDRLISQAKSHQRCGILFDIVSTTRVIGRGIPHMVGRLVYEHVEQAQASCPSLKFVFVGITDNVNCCAARDVFLRDEVLEGRYIGHSKRSFDAMDSTHMFAVLPTLVDGVRQGLPRATTLKPPLPSEAVGHGRVSKHDSPRDETFMTELELKSRTRPFSR